MNEGLNKYRESVKSGEITREKPLNPMEKHLADPKSRAKAMKAKCWDCTNGQRAEIKHCPCTDCPLYAFRPYK